MPASQNAWNDERVEQFLGGLLRLGVLLAAGTILAGGVWFLSRHGGDAAQYRVFHGEPAELRGMRVLSGALSQEGVGLIQLGILMLIATPVARVVFSVFAFARQRDGIYVGVTLIVLGVLAYSLFGEPL